MAQVQSAICKCAIYTIPERVWVAPSTLTTVYMYKLHAIWSPFFCDKGYEVSKARPCPGITVPQGTKLAMPSLPRFQRFQVIFTSWGRCPSCQMDWKNHQLVVSYMYVWIYIYIYHIYICTLYKSSESTCWSLLTRLTHYLQDRNCFSARKQLL